LETDDIIRDRVTSASAQIRSIMQYVQHVEHCTITALQEELILASKLRIIVLAKNMLLSRRSCYSMCELLPSVIALAGHVRVKIVAIFLKTVFLSRGSF
jgi:hypothetical protein